MPIIRDPEGNQTAALHQLVDFAGKRVLEVGCGDGRLTWRYAEKTAQVTGIDPYAEGIRVAKLNTPEHLKERVAFLASTIEDFLFPQDKPRFDTAVLSWSL
jgi:2-polyprenyl-3-methyl-5-hydroxy-6-metoxy-1,4-benzoquinol methylase